MKARLRWASALSMAVLSVSLIGFGTSQVAATPTLARAVPSCVARARRPRVSGRTRNWLAHGRGGCTGRGVATVTVRVCLQRKPFDKPPWKTVGCKTNAVEPGRTGRATASARRPDCPKAPPPSSGIPQNPFRTHTFVRARNSNGAVIAYKAAKSQKALDVCG